MSKAKVPEFDYGAELDRVGERLATALRDLPGLSLIPEKKRHTLINMKSGTMVEGKYCATDDDLAAIRELASAAMAVLTITPKARAHAASKAAA